MGRSDIDQKVVAYGLETLWTGNRLRSNTNDSSSSFGSSDNNSSHGLNSSATRRRSHRPRGCRGGRKNRKNKVLATREIDGVNTPSSPRQANKEIHHDAESRWSFNKRTEPRPGKSMVSLFDENREEEESSRMTVNETARQQFFAIQRDSQYDNLKNSLSRRTVHSSKADAQSSVGRILPPLPTGNLISVSVQEGPNPYALSSTKPSKNSHLPPFSTTTSSTPLASVEDHDDSDYRNRRIQKQREMMADGGSLFNTSPRSFLMRGRKSAAW